MCNYLSVVNLISNEEFPYGCVSAATSLATASGNARKADGFRQIRDAVGDHT